MSGPCKARDVEARAVRRVQRDVEVVTVFVCKWKSPFPQKTRGPPALTSASETDGEPAEPDMREPRTDVASPYYPTR